MELRQRKTDAKIQQQNDTDEPSKAKKEQNITVLVLGSKLMYKLEDPEISSNLKIHYIKSLKPIPASDGNTSGIVQKVRMVSYGLFKIIYQVFQLLWIMMVEVEKVDKILVQNPPALPTLAAACIVKVIRGAKLIIDWHNYAYSILELKVKQGVIVQAAKRYEILFGNLADYHLCVTNAMKQDLKENWGIKKPIIVLHDRAPNHFKRLNVPEIHELWSKLSQDPQFQDLAKATKTNNSGNITPFTQLITKKLEKKSTKKKQSNFVEMRLDRPKLLISSTSWTEDEDFEILLEAMIRCDQYYQEKHTDAESNDENKKLYIVLVITGKGPLKQYYLEKISQTKWCHVKIITAWLDSRDYVSLLGSADLGISLHTSSSGLDLPMKVVDMFGCELPVCAFKFNCIDELVQNNVNGLTFTNSKELTECLKALLIDNGSETNLEKLRKGVEPFANLSWEDNWNTNALSIFQ
ncbi:hypothetical protein H4219_002547 [Mycoemilia scoparia]|uniref:Chitobiosyldiphosphodolichol beta-mannosyltransferase n=1 Tax=Mycoemilia scoparia TaxID=417184 RepID=A0A9W8A310_9FUNG|nr:hypothetical protein H4219_002547 [Mycoemilia scoparia]